MIFVYIWLVLCFYWFVIWKFWDEIRAFFRAVGGGIAAMWEAFEAVFNALAHPNRRTKPKKGEYSCIYMHQSAQAETELYGHIVSTSILVHMEAGCMKHHLIYNARPVASAPGGKGAGSQARKPEQMHFEPVLNTVVETRVQAYCGHPDIEVYHTLDGCAHYSCSTCGAFLRTEINQSGNHL